MIRHTLFNALSPLVAGHCFYEVIPETQRVFPVIVYQFAHINPNSALEDGDLDDFSVQIDLYSPNPDDIFRLRKPVMQAVETACAFAERVSDGSDYEHDTRLHRRIFHYTIAYEETS